MDCGIPFCHEGCPLGQPHPGVERPRLPGRLVGAPSSGCTRRTTSPSSPAGCARPRARASCVLGINDDPVTIKQVEHEIAERAWDEGWVPPGAPARAHRASGSRWSGSGPPGSPPPSSWPGPGTSGRLRAGREARWAAPLRRSRSSRWRRGSSTAGSSRWRPRGSSSAARRVGRRQPSARRGASRALAAGRRASPTSGPRDAAARRVRRGRARRRGRRCPRDLEVPGPRARRGPLRHGVPEAVQPGLRGRARADPRSPPRAST